nr:uncharacterized protein LOC126532336 isoform X1 [Dermacentor andersoni]
MAYAMRFANRASALSLLRPVTASPAACFAPMSAMSPKQAQVTEHFFKKNKSLKRPLSPHLSIYAPVWNGCDAICLLAPVPALCGGPAGHAHLTHPHFPSEAWPGLCSLLPHFQWHAPPGLGFGPWLWPQGTLHDRLFCAWSQSCDGSSVGLQVDHPTPCLQCLRSRWQACPLSCRVLSLGVCIDRKKRYNTLLVCWVRVSVIVNKKSATAVHLSEAYSIFTRRSYVSCCPCTLF